MKFKIIDGNYKKEGLRIYEDTCPTLSARDYKEPKMVIMYEENNRGGIIQINPSTESGGSQPYQQNRIYDSQGIIPTLSKGNGGNTVPMIQVKSLQGNDEMPTMRSGGKSSFTKQHAHDIIVIQKTGGYCTTIKNNETGTLQSGGSNVMDKVPNIVAQIGRYNDDGTTEQKLEVNATDTTNTLTGVQKDNMLLLEGSIRRLTEIECERLQGFKDNHTKFGNYNGVVKEISKTQRYKLCGNAVTVDIVELIGKKLIKNF